MREGNKQQEGVNSEEEELDKRTDPAAVSPHKDGGHGWPGRYPAGQNPTAVRRHPHADS